MAYSSFVTEAWLAANFTPKAGITPGTDNQRCMDCDQILARYNVNISGITTTGNRLPSQDQITEKIQYILWNSTQFLQFIQTASTVTMTMNSALGFGFFVLIIATQSGTRTGGDPTYEGNAMTHLVTDGNISMWCWYGSGNGGTVSVPNSSNASIMIRANLCNYTGGTLQTYSLTSADGTGSVSCTCGVVPGKQTLVMDAMVMFAFDVGQPNHSETQWGLLGNEALLFYTGTQSTAQYFVPSSNQYTTSWDDATFGAAEFTQVIVSFYVD